MTLRNIDGVLIIPDRDAPHVPDDRPLRIEMGRPNQQTPAFPVLSRNPVDKIRGHIARDQKGHRRVVGERGISEH
jgi:hypothetical protein